MSRHRAGQKWRLQTARDIFPRNIAAVADTVPVCRETGQWIVNRRKVPPVVLLTSAMHVQFLGNPYVWGGTSLTKGVDCSGFVMQIYAHYGISLPHSSSALRGVGRGVSYSEAQPGDIICYSGHVAIISWRR